MSGADPRWMARALALAERGLETTDPNPRVGCVVLDANGDLVGEGFHARAGEPHAEVHALREAGDRARGGTVYVTLEPCAHTGRTAPCVDALLAAGVAKVVAAMQDPFPQVAGRGFERLRAAGVDVVVGLLESAARELNRGFVSRCERGRPWLRLKTGATLDGRTALADGRSQWISGEPARADVMRWRARSSAILTGIGTVLADDPSLTVRIGDAKPSRAPLRVVLDSGLRTPPGAKVLDDTAPTLIYGAPEAVARHHALPREKVSTCPRHATGLGLAIVLAELAQRGCNEVQVEAGPRLCGAFLEAGLVDEWLHYVNLSVLGDTAKPLFELPPLDALEVRFAFALIDQRPVGDDLRLLLRPRSV